MISKGQIIFICLLFFSLFEVNGQTFFDGFVKGKVQKGEGIYALLRRYEVNTPCDQIEFLINNQLSINDPLKLESVYVLPIMAIDTTKIPIEALTNASPKVIAKYNERVVENGLKNDSSTIWVPIHFIVCDEEGEKQALKDTLNIVPSSKEIKDKDLEKKVTKMGKYPLFGLEYSSPEILSDHLKGQVFYIVGGHGGPDPGAVGKADGHYIVEDEYAYDVALRLARRLIQHQATVFMIVRDKTHGIRDDKYLGFKHTEVHYPNKKIPLNQLKRLKARSDIINKLYDKQNKKGATKQYMIAIHIDGRPKNQRIDMFFYHDPISRNGKKLAQYFKSFMAKKYDEFQKGRGYKGTAKPRNLYILKNTKPIGLFVEIGNLHNEKDRKRILDPDNREAISKWLMQGFLEY